MAFVKGVIDSSTGAKLATYEMTPEGEVHGVVQINHGLAEHGARYERFADFLTQNGWGVIVHDHRGHGLTTADDGEARLYAYQDGWAKVIADVKSINAHIASHHPGKPIVCFGHSMGGLISMNYALRHPDTIAGCAIWNSNIDKGAGGLLKFVAGIGAALSKPTAPAGLIDTLTFKGWNKAFKADRPEFGWLSRDLDEVDKYIEDPLCGWTAKWSLWKDMAEGIVFAADERNWSSVPRDVAFHLVGGTKDPATNNAKAIEALGARLRRAGFGATEEILEGFRHETLNEKGREAVMERFAAWLSKIG